MASQSKITKRCFSCNTSLALYVGSIIQNLKPNSRSTMTICRDGYADYFVTTATEDWSAGTETPKSSDG